MSSGGGAGPLVPTFHGFVHNSMDGLVLFEACLSGKLHHVPRRPHDRERSSLIKSGSIFIYEENASGIKRWTDGVAWSPSRILGNFLIYRELEKPFPPGEKKRAMKRKRTSMPGEPYPRHPGSPGSGDNDAEPLSTPLTPPSPHPAGGNGGVDGKTDSSAGDQDKELERSLIGSLVDSYGFRPDGLVKKTMSISVGGVSHHMVSYYKVDDVKNNLLPRPLSDARLQNISVRPELYLKQNFRAPVEETEHYAIDGHMHAHPQMMYPGIPPSPYAMRPGSYMGAYGGMYGVSAPTTPYGAVSGASWPNQPVSAGAIPYGSHPGYSGSPYGSYYKPPPAQSGESKPPEHHQHGSHDMSTYGNSYSPTYSAGVQQRNGSQAAPNMMHTAYQTPVQQNSSSFGRQSYGGGGGTMASPTTNGHAVHQQSYSTNSAPQPYAVRSPSQQSYGMHSAPNSAIPPSPHHSVKSPTSAGGHQPPPASAGASSADAQMPYRSGSYAVGGTPQSAGAASDMSGLGISTGGYSTAPQTGANAQGYNYGNSAVAAHSYRADLASAAQAATHYNQ